jgi:hydroxyethylthiazole kinase
MSEKNLKITLGECLENVHAKTPLVHNITNYVTVNDVANVLLACGGSPIMSDEPKDVYDITSICGGLNINIGTLNERSIEAMMIAGLRSKELGHVILLDPVGTGASMLRTKTAQSIVESVKPDIIRGNISEIKALIKGTGTTKGVDADAADSVTEDNLDDMVAFVKEVAAKTDAVIAITGAIDLVADADVCYVIRNGRKEMSRITGTGCQLSGLATAYAVANPDNKVDAVAAAVCLMGLAGEIGWSRMQEGDGNSTYRNRIIDAIFNMDAKTLEEGAKYEIR